VVRISEGGISTTHVVPVTERRGSDFDLMERRKTNSSIYPRNDEIF
jgi:hypothetical protein